MSELLKDVKTVIVQEKPRYGKVILMTIIGVVIIEAALVTAALIVKFIRNSKFEADSDEYDDDFDPSARVDDVVVEFE